ncbi:MAG: 30S ribosomal protein S13 [Candidatus Pacearchaeota archaeon]|nr:MAG: 30S ribosomal protein S13 [Candidatus Pacearchaeota archaeon]
MAEEAEKKEESKEAEILVRIAATDIPGKLSVYAGLTKIKGVSWTFSNAVCKNLKINKNRKISDLSEEEIGKILAFIKNPNLPTWLLNRRKDIESGIDKHLITTELDLRREFDIRRMKKIKSYKGVRHAAGLPVRGQRTRAHFRKGKAIGVSRAKVKPGKKR